MLITYVISTLDQAIALFFIFLYPNLVVSKRFKSGVSKHKIKKIENHMAKKIRPINHCFLHQPLAEATGANSETGALKLIQGNQYDGVNQQTARIQPEENLSETATWL